MFKKMILAAVFVAAPMVLTQESSADDCYRGYRSSYRVPSVTYRSYQPYPYRNSVNRVYTAPYRSLYVPSYRAPYYGYGTRYGYGVPYYGNGIGINRGGISLQFGF